MVGPDLLVAQSPYPDRVDDYQVALPPSSWYDYWTGSRIDPTSGRKGIDNAAIAQPEVHIHRTLETLPVFVRAGSIVPEQPLVQSTEEKPVGTADAARLSADDASGADCEGSLYLDDGVSYDFKKGDYLRVQFACRLSAQGLIVTVAPREGTFRAMVEAAFDRGVRGNEAVCGRDRHVARPSGRARRSPPTSMQSIIVSRRWSTTIRRGCSCS